MVSQQSRRDNSHKIMRAGASALGFLPVGKFLPIAALLLVLGRAMAAEPQTTATLEMNVASAEWGTIISGNSQYSDQHGASNLVDGLATKGHGWLSEDHAALPQRVTFDFEEPFLLTGIRVEQTQWDGAMYCTKDFDVQITPDGQTWTKVASGTLDAEPGSKAELRFAPTLAKALRLTITSSYSEVQTCGLGEVEIMATLPKDATPPYRGADSAIAWDTLRGHFKMALKLDPPAPAWRSMTNSKAFPVEYRSRDYHLTLNEVKRSSQSVVVDYTLNRVDGQSFKVIDFQLDCKTSYSGVYKMFTPSTMAQQNYKLDLPFRMAGHGSGINETSVIWMQQTDGANALTIGMIDQLPSTSLEGSSYDFGNGGEAPGLANSYVRATFRRSGNAAQQVTTYHDGIYINADPTISWFDALTDYAQAVDAARAFRTNPLGDHAFNSMWHSWYAHGADIDEAQIRKDGQAAAELGFKTIEIDAGWNMVGYKVEEEGHHDFVAARFPNPKGMIDDLHKQGLRVILHVAPLLMGPESKTYPAMKDCVIKVNGKEGLHLDPRYKKSLDFLLAAWDKLFVEYGVDGLWYDFLEVPEGDSPTPGMELLSADLQEGYTLLMEALYKRALEHNPNAVIILRRGSANLNAKRYCTHVWPSDTPQDYNMNRRDVVFMKTFGPGVLTHACCTSWAISESEENVGCQMASIVFAGVPALSVKLAESPAAHNRIMKAWLDYYEQNKRDLVLGRMTPLLPTPPSAALRIEAETQAFFGFFEAMPGLITLTRPVDKVTIINAWSSRTVTRLEGLTGTFKAEVFDHAWNPVTDRILTCEQNGLNLNFASPTKCSSIVLTRQ